jgi:hypothetical protein
VTSDAGPPDFASYRAELVVRPVPPPVGVVDRDRFRAAIAAIDAVLAEDPSRVVVGGSPLPEEQVHAALVTDWIRHLDPAATEAQLLAGRAHHLRRWELPRNDYPSGRAGYLRWRATARTRQAAAVATVLTEAGYDAAAVGRVQQLVRKEGLSRDPQVQTHEDALCLVFIQTQSLELAAQLGEEHMVEVVAKTARKMSPRALETVAALDLDPAVAGIIARATA